jgi:hypothetical protein
MANVGTMPPMFNTGAALAATTMQTAPASSPVNATPVNATRATATRPAAGQAMRPAVRHDTRAWKLQVWASFGIAIALAGIGLAWLPGVDLDRAFMFMGYLFTLSTAFALAKHVRDNEAQRVDTPMWNLVVWSGFALAMGLTGWGLWRMDINPTYKAFLGVSWLFLVSSAFTLAKTLRDAHEAALADAAAAAVAAQAEPRE